MRSRPTFLLRCYKGKCAFQPDFRLTVSPNSCPTIGPIFLPLFRWGVFTIGSPGVKAVWERPDIATVECASLERWLSQFALVLGVPIHYSHEATGQLTLVPSYHQQRGIRSIFPQFPSYTAAVRNTLTNEDKELPFHVLLICDGTKSVFHNSLNAPMLIMESVPFQYPFHEDEPGKECVSGLPFT